MTKKKNPNLTRSQANQLAAIEQKKAKTGIFSEAARLKMTETRRQQGLEQRKRSSKYMLPHLKVVYLHRHLKTKEYFWCGHGTWLRPYKTGNRTKAWKDYIAKHGKEYEVIIVQAGLTKEYALWLEVQLTNQLGTVQAGTGTLLNAVGTSKGTKRSNQFKQNVKNGITQWWARRKTKMGQTICKNG